MSPQHDGAMPADRDIRDQAVDDLLVDHEAERQDLEAKMVENARPTLEALARQAVKKVAVPNPSREIVREAYRALTRGVLEGFCAAGNDFQDMVIRQSEEKYQALRQRSGARIIIEPITKARIKARKEAIAAKREVKDE